MGFCSAEFSILMWYSLVYQQDNLPVGLAFVIKQGRLPVTSFGLFNGPRWNTILSSVLVCIVWSNILLTGLAA